MPFFFFSKAGSIDPAEQTTVYMLPLHADNGRRSQENHKWFVGSELSAK
ncbi:DUF1541 domain-containing protein [Brevibacillus porteri]